MSYNYLHNMPHQSFLFYPSISASTNLIYPLYKWMQISSTPSITLRSSINHCQSIQESELQHNFTPSDHLSPYSTCMYYKITQSTNLSLQPSVTLSVHQNSNNHSVNHSLSPCIAQTNNHSIHQPITPSNNHPHSIDQPLSFTTNHLPVTHLIH